MKQLIEGYRSFRSSVYPGMRAEYDRLVASGQRPETMIISCCDSRVQPTTLFQAAPGEYFVMRNIANLVPPYVPDGGCHGTSVAIEYATTALDVERIVVLGHSHCGGIAAFLDNRHDLSKAGEFAAPWTALLEAAYAEVDDADSLSPAERQRQVELASVRRSLANLRAFPTVAARVKSQGLVLAGAYFDIADGQLYLCDPETGAFRPVD